MKERNCVEKKSVLQFCEIKIDFALSLLNENRGNFYYK